MARDRWEPISRDDVDGARRRRAVDRDVALHASGLPCEGCGETARLSGGAGCSCRVSADELAARCLDLADRIHFSGETGNGNPARL